MRMIIVYAFLLCSLVFVSGCTQEGDTLIKKDFNTFNSYFANGLSCSSISANTLSGISGSINRQLVVGNFPLIIEVDNFYLNNIYDYNVSAVNSSFTITFKNKIWDDESIGVCLATSNSSISNSVYLGVNCSGLDGGTGRVLVSNITSPLLVSVDGQLLNGGFDYSNIAGSITFNNKIYDDMVISVWG